MSKYSSPKFKNVEFKANLCTFRKTSISYKEILFYFLLKNRL